MLVRIAINNILSFGLQREFHLLPNTRLGTLKDHIYKFQNFEYLKLSAIYGANGTGKSNLVHCLGMLQYLVTKEQIPTKLKNGQFKFQENKSDTPQLIVVEFIFEETAFYYGVEISDGIILTEELYQSGLGTKRDTLIFERKTDKEGNTTINFPEKFEKQEKNRILKEVLLQEFVRPNKPVIKLLANRDNKDLQIVKKAYNWFEEGLTIIAPHSKPGALAIHLEQDSALNIFTNNIMHSFNIGIKGVKVQTEKAEDFFGKDNINDFKEIFEQLRENQEKVARFNIANQNEISLVAENNQLYVKTLQIEHTGSNDTSVFFDLEEESDGTIRLLDFVPAFNDLVNQKRVFVIDEIERSLHPLLIRELIKKFSMDTLTKGQLIFTTHESNLLDQAIFRTDEIWFTEKDNTGSTDMYSLSAFKEHKTIDIQKGYLSGRYGGIPFLGNLQDLNWHNYVTQE
ncbi:AAA family ATPase [Emticicia sp. 17c]|uniref:AAA family ATPase n=1 Tax=Emticicia sp. 17c TaxID=3127704 RepID=UPI00301D8336